MNKAERKTLEEKVLVLEEICRQQRDSLATQQEAIVQLNEEVDRVIGAITEKYGGEDKTISFSVERHERILDEYTVRVRHDKETKSFVAQLVKIKMEE